MRRCSVKTGEIVMNLSFKSVGQQRSKIVTCEERRGILQARIAEEPARMPSEGICDNEGVRRGIMTQIKFAMNSAPLKKYERDAAMDIEADRRRETESESWTVSYGYLLFFLESCAHFD